MDNSTRRKIVPANKLTVLGFFSTAMLEISRRIGDAGSWL